MLIMSGTDLKIVSTIILTLLYSILNFKAVSYVYTYVLCRFKDLTWSNLWNRMCVSGGV